MTMQRQQKTNTRKQANNLKRHNKQTKKTKKALVSPIGMGFSFYTNKSFSLVASSLP